MVTQWSDNIAVADLQDEPTLSEDLASLAEQSALVGPRATHLVLNFTGVTYINSSNLGQLLHLRRVLAQANRRLVLCAMSEEIRSTFQVTGVHKLFTFAGDALSALATLQLEDDIRGE